MLQKYKALKDAHDTLLRVGPDPFAVTFDRILSATEAQLGERRVLLFGTNNYLGLTFDPASIRAGVEALESQGTGTTGSRIANGSYGGHAALERDIARFLGKREAMVFSTGYQANLGAIAGLAGKDDHLLLDADSHASIYDGARLAGAQVTRFRHNDPDDLRRRLRVLASQPGEKLIIVEGIYSMLGDSAPLRAFAEVKREAGAWLMVDEAHSLGVLGEQGRGLGEAHGVEDDVDYVVGTFSKSLGAVGGFCASSVPDFGLLRLAARAYMFTASLPPSVIATVTRSLAELQARPELRQQLARNSQRMHAGLLAAGFALGPEASPIVSVRCPDETAALTLWHGLLAEGIYVNLALRTATPNAQPLLRTSVCAAHTPEQIDQAVAAITRIGHQLGMVGPISQAAE